MTNIVTFLRKFLFMKISKKMLALVMLCLYVFVWKGATKGTTQNLLKDSCLVTSYISNKASFKKKALIGLLGKVDVLTQKKKKTILCCNYSQLPLIKPNLFCH